MTYLSSLPTAVIASMPTPKNCARLHPVCPPVRERARAYTVLVKFSGQAVTAGCWFAVVRIYPPSQFPNHSPLVLQAFNQWLYLMATGDVEHATQLIS